MVTTVAIKDETGAMLKDVKEQFQAQSYDEVIQKLILNIKKPKTSYFGAFPGLGKFERDKRDRFN